MRVLIDVNHPAHVHLFRPAAQLWQGQEEAVLFTATDKDVTTRLLKAYNLPHEILYTRGSGKLDLAKELVFRTWKLIQTARKFDPDVILSMGSPTAAWASVAIRRPHVAFEDTEDSIGQIWLYRPFTRYILVPECFMLDFGGKMIRYAGSNELAYLHPNRFLPNPMKIEPLNSRERFFVVRYVSWDASHDKGEGGLSAAGKKHLLDLLQGQGRVVLSVEKKPPVLLGKNGQPDQELSADSMHHLLAFATMYVGEGVTAASESAILGTPSILINSREVGYIKEQEEVYHLTYRFADEQAAFDKIRRMLAQPDLKNVWQLRREVLLHDKIDVTAWLDEFLRENL